ncbi:MAG: MFS transporter, partial [Atribacterota bacterium]
VGSLDYAFFSLGTAVASTTTLLPVFARNLGATNVEIGLIPALYYLGLSIPSLFCGIYSSRLERKLPFILKFTMLERLPYLGIALVAFFLASLSSATALGLFFLLLSVSFGVMGILTPVWMEMVGKVINPTRIGVYFALGNGIGALMGIWGSRLAELFIQRLPFARNFGYCFLLTILAMLVSFIFIALTREEKENLPPPKKEYLRTLGRIFRRDPNFRSFTIARGFLAMGVMGGAFYTVHALQSFHVPDSLIARYNAVFLVSQALSNFIWGPLGDRKGHKLVVLLGCLSILLSNVIAIISPGPSSFYFAYAFFGIYWSAIWVGGIAILLDFGPREQRSAYIGLGYFLSTFPSFFTPLLGGKIADSFGYRNVFWVSLLINVVAFVLLMGVKEPRVFRESELD